LSNCIQEISHARSDRCFPCSRRWRRGLRQHAAAPAANGCGRACAAARSDDERAGQRHVQGADRVDRRLTPALPQDAAMASTRVSNNRFVLGGIHAKIGQDGNVMGRARNGTTITGMLANDSLDVTTMGHGCGYHYSLARS